MAKGLAQRTLVASDRRLATVALTPRGQALYARVLPRVAAINRAQMALQDYRDVPALEEALYILIKSYDALGLTQLRDDSARIMAATYPKSSFMAEGFRPAGKPWWKLW